MDLKDVVWERKHRVRKFPRMLGLFLKGTCHWDYLNPRPSTLNPTLNPKPYLLFGVGRGPAFLASRCRP